MKQLKRWFGIALALCGLVAGGLFIAGEWEPVTEPEMPSLMVQGPVNESDPNSKPTKEPKGKPGKEPQISQGYTWSG